jgi:hypothetical protein
VITADARSSMVAANFAAAIGCVFFSDGAASAPLNPARSA